MQFCCQAVDKVLAFGACPGRTRREEPVCLCAISHLKLDRCDRSLCKTVKRSSFDVLCGNLTAFPETKFFGRERRRVSEPIQEEITLRKQQSFVDSKRSGLIQVFCMNVHTTATETFVKHERWNLWVRTQSLLSFVVVHAPGCCYTDLNRAVLENEGRVWIQVCRQCVFWEHCALRVVRDYFLNGQTVVLFWFLFRNVPLDEISIEDDSDVCFVVGTEKQSQWNEVPVIHGVATFQSAVVASSIQAAFC